MPENASSSHILDLPPLQSKKNRDGEILGTVRWDSVERQSVDAPGPCALQHLLQHPRPRNLGRSLDTSCTTAHFLGERRMESGRTPVHLSRFSRCSGRSMQCSPFVQTSSFLLLHKPSHSDQIVYLFKPPSRIARENPLVETIPASHRPSELEKIASAVWLCCRSSDPNHLRHKPGHSGDHSDLLWGRVQ